MKKYVLASGQAGHGRRTGRRGAGLRNSSDNDNDSSNNNNDNDNNT